jgi:hypothetical protein
MKPTPTEPPATPSTAEVLGSHKVIVTRLDGTTQEVTVRALRMRDFPTYFDLRSSPDGFAGLAELLASQPSGWADQLEDASVYRICDVGEELNFSRAVGWKERQLNRLNNSQSLLSVDRQLLERCVSMLRASQPPSASP